eukprot:TRINITY_DN7246_c1_g1_i1.p1 TRINITY_DN7246_c1_g1~~TRINITY_DN7246_c1_g1_i1.p1  ORF type:complete len:178 (+),score=15.86 TRINITY_DN7246_c1_g1_i1:393-926(+)
MSPMALSFSKRLKSPKYKFGDKPASSVNPFDLSFCRPSHLDELQLKRWSGGIGKLNVLPNHDFNHMILGLDFKVSEFNGSKRCRFNPSAVNDRIIVKLKSVPDFEGRLVRVFIGYNKNCVQKWGDADFSNQAPIFLEIGIPIHDPLIFRSIFMETTIRPKKKLVQILNFLNNEFLHE